MRYTLLALASVLLLIGCTRVVMVPASSPEVVVVNDQDRGNGANGVARTLHVPKGHYPPPGQCRVWYEGRPPGHQPAPGRCEQFIGKVPAGAFILYNDRAWDARYDWGRHSRRNPGAVPVIIIRLTEPARRR
jgi:hypothetical protein